MSARELSTRDIQGMYFERLAVATGASWLEAVSNYFDSDQEVEKYPWLGMTPAFRKWVGGRHAKRLGTSKAEITNYHYEASLEIDNSDLRRDKTDQLRVRIGEFATRSVTHWSSLVSDVIAAGAATVGYDGKYFYDTTHSEGASGTLSNKITVDISGVPATQHGAAVTAPSPEEMQWAMLQSIMQMFTFKDDVGEPINELAQSFLVMVPIGLMIPASAALTMVRNAAATTLSVENFKIGLAVNPRLTSAGWTDQFVTFRTDGDVKPIIRQEEQETKLKILDEGSDFEFNNDAIQVGQDSWRGAGPGRWQSVCHTTLV